MSPADVPGSLKDWIPWAQYGSAPPVVPHQFDNPRILVPTWPSRLTIRAGKQSAAFSQHWRIFVKNLVPLPGDSNLWPQQVRVNGKPAVIVTRSGRPWLLLPKGTHTISGRFFYTQLPDSLQIPARTALVQLSVNGRPVLSPPLGQTGKLRLSGRNNQQTAVRAEDSLRLNIHRHIIDTIPLEMHITIEMIVSGSHREISLGRVFADDFSPLAIESTLPVMFDKKSEIRAQVRPGRWLLTIKTRRLSSNSSFSRPKQSSPWPDEEIWTFEARPRLRRSTVEGAVQVDPQQTVIPDKYKKFPAYLVSRTTDFILTEKSRGELSSRPDELKLKRELWLDFDGTGFSVRDSITGEVRSGWRLSLARPYLLGSMSTAGREALITTHGDTNSAGLELRFGTVDLKADSRLEGSHRSMPAFGWNKDFRTASGVLHLPPGWQIFHTFGIDTISRSWIRDWSLLDLFALLLIAVVFYRLYGRTAAVLALLTLTLLVNEEKAPVWTWLNILTATALLRVVHHTILRRLLTAYRVLGLAFLLIISLPFAVTQVKTGLFPQLERPQSGPVLGRDRVRRTRAPRAVKEEVQLDEFEEDTAVAPSAVRGEDNRPHRQARKKYSRSPASSPVQSALQQQSRYNNYQQQMQLYYANNKVQTGQGVPTWHWKQVRFGWSGPVDKDQRLRFIFINPAGTLILSLLRTVLLALLISVVLGVRLDRLRLPNNFKFPGRTAATVLLLLLFPLCLRAEYPPPQLLSELKERTLAEEKPLELEQYAHYQDMQLNIKNGRLTIRAEVHCAADVALPLPGSAGQWLPTDARLGPGNAELCRQSNGRLSIYLPRGIHTLVLEGPLPQRDTFQLLLHERPHRLRVSAGDYTVDGLRENGLVEKQLQFTRRRSQDTAAPRAYEITRLPPFVTLTRTLQLGLQWELQTTVTRRSAGASAVVMRVPLLSGESVTSDGVRTENGVVLVSMSPGRRSFTWHSVLTQRPTFTLTASSNTAWYERWELEAQGMWHVNFSGLVPVRTTDSEGQWKPLWRPWPGEQLTLELSQPAGVAGPTWTLQSSELTCRPGNRITDTSLLIKIRSSQGGRTSLSLPPGARLSSVSINKRLEPIEQQSNTVTLPLAIGTQDIVLTWSEPRPISLLFSTPTPALRQGGVDTRLEIKLPRNRWLLATGGPGIGPVVLFWATALVVLLVSLILARWPAVPLAWHHWLLLCLGLTQAHILVSVPVIAWFFLLAMRSRLTRHLQGRHLFNLLQIFTIILTLTAMGCLIGGITSGLLGSPDMQLNGSPTGATALSWYQDRSPAQLPAAWVLSVPIMLFRVLMLAWSLWLALRLVSWLKWAWEQFTTDGAWRKRPQRPPSQQDAAESQGDSES
jgi:hypothetical protein